MTIAIEKIDHVAITVVDLAISVAFYCRVLDAQVLQQHELDGRVMVVRLGIGGAMINIHQAGHGHPLVARHPTPGSVDLCVRWTEAIDTAIAHLQQRGIAIIEGPVRRHASDGKVGRSVYFRDPDGNLIEFLSTAEAPP